MIKSLKTLSITAGQTGRIDRLQDRQIVDQVDYEIDDQIEGQTDRQKDCRIYRQTMIDKTDC